MTMDVLKATGRFFTIFIGSVIIGAMTALLVAFMIKRQSSYQIAPKQDEVVEEDKKNIRQLTYEQEVTFNAEISMILMCPWVCYLIADGLSLSGIVAILKHFGP